MAYSIRFTVFSKENGSVLLSIEPSWWSVNELKKSLKVNWVVSNDTGSYRDEDADISVAEARELHAQFKPIVMESIAFNTQCIESEKSKTDKYASKRLADYTDCVACYKAEVESIESALEDDVARSSRFHVCIFEWESGL
jgi:predicted P-loop ATPase/GTPase